MTNFLLSETTAKELQKLLSDYKTGRLGNSTHVEKDQRVRPNESYFAKLDEDIDAATDNAGTIEPTTGDASLFKIRPYEATPDFTDTTLTQEVWNLHTRAYEAGSYVKLQREPISGKYVIDEPVLIQRFELQDDLVEFGSSAQAWSITLNSLTGWDRAATTTEIFPHAGYTGFKWGTQSDDVNNVGDALWCIQQGGVWFAMCGGHHVTKGTAQADASAGNTLNIVATAGQGDVGLPGGSPAIEERSITINAEAFNDISNGDEVLVFWHGDYLAVKIENDPYTAGCGIEITNGEISIDTGDVVGDHLIVTDTCRLNVDAATLIGCGLEENANVIEVDNTALAGDGLTAGTGCTLDVDPGCGLKIDTGKIAVDPTALEGAGIVAAGCGFDVDVGDCLVIDNDNAVAFDTTVDDSIAFSAVTAITRTGDNLQVTTTAFSLDTNECGVLVGFNNDGASTSTVDVCNCGNGNGSGSGSGDTIPDPREEGKCINDTFTDTNGTTLSAHTMDAGPGWTIEAGTTRYSGK